MNTKTKEIETENEKEREKISRENVVFREEGRGREGGVCVDEEIWREGGSEGRKFKDGIHDLIDVEIENESESASKNKEREMEREERERLSERGGEEIEREIGERERGGAAKLIGIDDYIDSLSNKERERERENKPSKENTRCIL